MRSFFRRLRWLTQRSRKERNSRGTRVPLEEEAEQHQAEGLAEEQARWRRAASWATLLCCRRTRARPGPGHSWNNSPGHSLRPSHDRRNKLQRMAILLLALESGPTRRSSASWIRSCCAR